ncbi:MAG: heparan-alpha-glucosaminide N-acetyltransferase domain-containing protein [Polyangiales bacterium]
MEPLRHNGAVGRKRFVDWSRGVAVIGMVVWHTADGWLAPAVREGAGWSVLRFIGGFPAPCFLFLAGVGAALGAREGRAETRALRASLARGLEIMLLGYALRLQTWIIDGGGALHAAMARGWVPLGLGYFLAWRALHAPRERAVRLAAAAACAVVLGLAQVPWLAPGRLPRLLQVDVLQAIGASLVLLELGERRMRLMQRPVVAIALGLLVAVATAPLASILPSLIPVPLAAYLGKFAVAAGQPAPALFPLFPWFSYACIGAAFGCWLRRSDDADMLVVQSGVAGAAIALLTSEAHPSVQSLIATAGWCVHPLRVLFRVGLVLTLVLFGWSWASEGRGRLVATFGRASLRIYWAHLMVAYGALGTAWHKRLGVGEWCALAALLLAAMWFLALLRKRPLGGPTIEATS